MAEINEIIDDVKSAVGDKGFLFLIAALVIIFIINAMRGSSSEGSETVVTVPTAYTSYPDSVTNANVIIDTLQNSIDYSHGELSEQMKDGFDSINVNVSDNASALNTRLDDMSQNITDELGELGTNIVDMNNDLRDYIGENFTATNDYINQGIQQTAALSNKIDSVSNEVTELKDYTVKKDLTESTSKKTGLEHFKVVQKTDTFPISHYRGVSIVDGLKSIGRYEESSFANRELIAEANGIKEYVGSSDQNGMMLAMLKSGTLKNPFSK